MTDDTYIVENSENMTYREFTNSFALSSNRHRLKLKLRHTQKIDQDDVIWDKLVELDLFDGTKKVGLKRLLLLKF